MTAFQIIYVLNSFSKILILKENCKNKVRKNINKNCVYILTNGTENTNSLQNKKSYNHQTEKVSHCKLEINCG